MSALLILVCLAAVAAIGLCLYTVASDHELLFDRWFPLLVLFAPAAVVALAVTPLAAVTTLLTGGRKLSRRQRTICHGALVSSGVLYASLLWICPLPLRPELPRSVRDARQFLTYRRLLHNVDGVNWNRLENERGEQLSRTERETLRDAADGFYDLLINADLDQAQLWGARCEFMLGKYRDAIDYLVSNDLHVVRQQLIDRLIARCPPREVASLMSDGYDLEQGTSPFGQWNDPVYSYELTVAARSFAAHGQMRSAALLKAAWAEAARMGSHRLGAQRQKADEAIRSLRQYYLSQATAEPRLARSYLERAAATTLDEDIADQASGRREAGSLLLRAGLPLRAVWQLRQARDLSGKGGLDAVHAERLHQAETEAARAYADYEAELRRISPFLDELEAQPDYNFQGADFEIKLNAGLDCPESIADDLIYARRRPHSYISGRFPEALIHACREVLKKSPIDRAPEIEAEIIQQKYGGQNDEALPALARALQKYRDFPGEERLLVDFWRAAVYADLRLGSTSSSVQAIEDRDLRQTASMIAQFGNGIWLLLMRGPAEAAPALARVELARPSRWLNRVVDAMMLANTVDLAAAPSLAGFCFLRTGQHDKARAQFARVLRHPQVYSCQRAAGLGRALCDLHDGKLERALEQFASLDQTSGPIAVWPYGLLDAVFGVLITDRQGEQLAQSASATIRSRACWSQILRDLRGEQYGDAVGRIERFVTQFPDQFAARGLFPRLCSLERRAIPGRQWESVTERDLLAPEPYAARFLRLIEQFLERARWSGTSQLDDLLFETRSRPVAFRLRRLGHRLSNRAAWNLRVRRRFEALPTRDQATLEVAGWLAEDPGSATLVGPATKTWLLSATLFDQETIDLVPGIRQRIPMALRYLDGVTPALERIDRLLKEFPRSTQTAVAHLLAVRACERRAGILAGLDVMKQTRAAIASTLASARAHHSALLAQNPKSREAKESAKLIKSLVAQVRQVERQRAGL